MTHLLEEAINLAKIYLGNNVMPHDKVPALIREIYQTLSELSDRDPESVDENSEAEGAHEAGVGYKTAAVLHDDLDDEVFDGLDPWLAKRINHKLATKLDPSREPHPSVFPDHLVCLEDGKEVVLLRPYVKKHFGLSFAEYIDKWNLPDDYPTAPPSYLKAKREAAKASGLGVTTRAKKERPVRRAKARA